MRNFTDTFIGAASTRRSQLSLWRTNIQPHVNVSDNHLNEMFIRELVNKWAGLSPGTIKQLISITKRYILWKTGSNVHCGGISRTVTKGQSEKVIWTNEETQKGLDLAWHINRPLWQILMFSLCTGSRISESLAVQINDIDFQNQVIKIRRSKTNTLSIVPIHSSLLPVLLDLSSVKTGFIFKQSNPNRTLKKLCKLANISAVTSHSFRHQFITRALDAGMNAKKVAKIVGHKNVTTTLNVYWQYRNPIEKEDLSFLDDQKL